MNDNEVSLAFQIILKNWKNCKLGDLAFLLKYLKGGEMTELSKLEKIQPNGPYGLLTTSNKSVWQYTNVKDAIHTMRLHGLTYCELEESLLNLTDDEKKYLKNLGTIHTRLNTQGIAHLMFDEAKERGYLDNGNLTTEEINEFREIDMCHANDFIRYMIEHGETCDELEKYNGRISHKEALELEFVKK
jgi:hypothetical protein